MEQKHEVEPSIVYFYLYCLVRSVGWTILFAVFTGMGLYIITPKLSNDVAGGDFELSDSVIFGKEDPSEISNYSIRSTMIELRDNVQSGANNSLALSNLEKACEKKCESHYQEGTMYCSSGRCVDLPSQTTTSCFRPDTCTDEMLETIEHVQNMKDAGVLTLEKYPVYMQGHEKFNLTVWQKTITLSFSFLIILFGVFVFAAKIKQRLLKKEDEKIFWVSLYIPKILSDRPYENPPVSDKMKSTELRRVKEYKKIPQEMIDQVDEVIEILERRERNL